MPSISMFYGIIVYIYLNIEIEELQTGMSVLP